MPKKSPASTPSVIPTRRLWRWWFIGVASFVLVLLAATAGYAFYYQNRIVPHTTVGGVAVGGLTVTQAQQALAAREQDFGKTSLELNYQGKSWKIMPSDLQPAFQTTQAVATAYQLSRNGSFFRQITELTGGLFVKHSFPLTISNLSDKGESKLHDVVLKEVEVPFTETGISFVPGKVVVVPGKEGQAVNIPRFNQDLASALVRKGTDITLTMVPTSPTLTEEQLEPLRAQADQILSAAWTIQLGNQNVTLDPATVATWLSLQAKPNPSLVLAQDKLTAYVTSLAGQIQKTPTNAMLGVVNGAVTVVQEGKDGVSLDIGQTSTAISTALMGANPTTRTIASVAQVVHPDIYSGNLVSQGFDQLIGTGTTDFSGSPSNRVANITTGERMITGQIVKSGAEFSTVGALGPIDEAHGYVQGLVIINNQTIPADGGGLCQVSTTLFRSVLNAGLPVTARSPHSYEVSYYQRGVGPGLDATIYDPSPDFKWKNDTGHDIYIQGTISGTKLTFDLYGTSDGRTASIDGPHTLETYQPSGPPIYVNTDTLPKGTTEQIDPPVPGAKTTATYTVTSKDGKVTTQVFNSTYQAMPAQYLVGTR